MTRTTWNPGMLLETSGHYWRSFALHAGVKLGVFTALGGLSLTAEAVGEAIDADRRATAMLLDALTAMGLIVKTGDRYANCPESLRYLSEDSGDYIGYMIRHHHHLVESWRRLDVAVQTGAPVRERTSHDDTEQRRDFLMGMVNNARLLAPRLVPEIDLSGRRHLLDLGGGPGTYAIAFCSAYPELRATVFDLPATRPFAEEVIGNARLADRIAFQEGSYLTDPVPGTYDAAWLSHILHAEGPEDGRRIVRKAVSALESGGVIFIHDFVLEESRDRPLFPALFSLNMLVRTDAGQAYTQQEITDMLAAAGVQQVQRLPFVGPTESGILAGVVP